MRRLFWCIHPGPFFCFPLLPSWAGKKGCISWSGQIKWLNLWWVPLLPPFNFPKWLSFLLIFCFNLTRNQGGIEGCPVDLRSSIIVFLSSDLSLWASTNLGCCLVQCCCFRRLRYIVAGSDVVFLCRRYGYFPQTLTLSLVFWQKHACWPEEQFLSLWKHQLAYQIQPCPL